MGASVLRTYERLKVNLLVILSVHQWDVEFEWKTITGYIFTYK